MDTKNRFTKFIDNLNKLNAKVVVFDLDLTASKIHSFGALCRIDFDKYVESASSDFVEIVPLLIEKGFELAIATFNDEHIKKLFPLLSLNLRNNRLDGMPRDPNDIIAGEELVIAFLDHHFGEEIRSKFVIVAKNPNFYSAEKVDKEEHIKEIADKFNVNINDCVLFDDQIANVEGARFPAFLVDGEDGFKLEHFKF
ncbi:hypothetical protein MHBO_000033 [Bonamia ostreae]|uniref:Uncharacterized protein n=1 Tax=Bonamia ostreae TaxID=126728 RepID=A0ABV2AET9_9EUKA